MASLSQQTIVRRVASTSEDTPSHAPNPAATQSEPSITPEAPTPMLDVHPAHHAASTWRDFFIHIATIALGLLLAVGLEQTVEYVHHKRQVAETREALRVERLYNIRHFAVQTDEFLRFGPILQSNLDILHYIRKHPHSTPDQWPGHFRWAAVSVGYRDSSWKTAEESTILQYMPRAEVAEYRSLYNRLDGLNQRHRNYSEALAHARGFALRNPDPAQLSPVELDREIEFMADAILLQSMLANDQRNVNNNFPDFKPAPNGEQIRSILRPASDPDPADTAATRAFVKRLNDAQAQFKDESEGNEGGNH